MTLHSAGKWYSNHSCSTCGTLYIPYNINISCPICGNKEHLECDFIDLAVRSIMINLREHGSCIPPAWCIHSFSDDLLLWLLIIFEMYKTVKDVDKFRLCVRNEIKKNKKVPSYLKKHFIVIAIFVKAVLEKRKNDPLPDPDVIRKELQNFKFI